MTARVWVRREVRLAALLILLILLVTLRAPGFLSIANLQSVLLWVPLLVLVALGQMIVILTRGIDVSVGSTLALSGMIATLLLRDHPTLSVYAAAGIALGVGAVGGAVNGGLIAGFGVPPIVATLGTLGIFRGLTFLVSGGRQVDDYQLPRALARWSMEGPGGQSVVPWVVIVALAAAGLMHGMLTQTGWGRDLYAVGGDPDGAKQRGVRIGRVTWAAYTVCGAGAGLAGLLYASRFGTVNPASIGSGFELLVIAATVIGGVSIFGGVGSVGGVLLGCLLLGTINVALSVLNIADTWQMAVYGLVILLAVLWDDAALTALRRRTTGE